MKQGRRPAERTSSSKRLLVCYSNYQAFGSGKGNAQTKECRFHVKRKRVNNRWSKRNGKTVLTNRTNDHSEEESGGDLPNIPVLHTAGGGKLEFKSVSGFCVRMIL